MSEVLKLYGFDEEISSKSSAVAGIAVVGIAIVGTSIHATDTSGVVYPIADIDDLCIEHKIDGCDVLSFVISTKHKYYKNIVEEAKIEYADNVWLIKKINDDKVECDIDFDFLKSTVYSSYRSETRTLTEVLQDHLPDGWTVENGNIVSIRRTISFDYCTDYDIVMQCMDTYKVYFVWKTLNKTVTVYNSDSMQDTGEYLTDELNLKNVVYKGNTKDFVTRLYAYGASGMSIAQATYEDESGNVVEYGLPYVDCFGYSNKIVCGVWTDERYTDANNLKADAEEKVASMAYPVRSYECEVIDLAKQNPNYTFLDIKMHKKLTLIDTERGMKVKHQVVNYKEYPNEPSRNVVTLSCVPGDIMETVRQTNTSIKTEIEKNNNWVNERVMQVTAIMSTALGGYVYSTDSEIYIMDTDDPATALNVWRWNVNGFGHSSTGIDGPYSMAMTYDNRFIADIIEATVIRGSRIEAGSIQAEAISQAYTDGVLTQSFESAKGYVESAISEIQNYLTNDDESGELDLIKKEMSNLKQTADSLTAKFSTEYQGGINYVQNSAGLNGLSSDWKYTGTVVTLQSSDTKNCTISNSCFRLSGGATLKQVISTLVIGKVYTVSIKAKKTADLVDGYFKVTYNGSHVEYLVNTQDTYDWTQYSVTLQEVTDGTLTIEMSVTNDYLYVSDIIVSEGSVIKEWTPAPNEIYTEEVKVDKNGIEVSNADSDTRTVINHTEFAVYSGEEKAITVNKDETHLKKSIVESDLTIGKMKFLPLDDPSDGVNIVILD